MQRFVFTLTVIVLLFTLTSTELKSQTLHPKVSAMFENAIDSIEPTVPVVHLKSDPGEKINLAKIEKDKVTKLAEKVMAWRKTMPVEIAVNH